MEREPHLYAVIEYPYEPPAFAGPFGPRPWPAFVRLSGETPDREVALVVARFAAYGGGATSLAGLVEAFPNIAAGGLAAADERLTVGSLQWHGADLASSYSSRRRTHSFPRRGPSSRPFGTISR